MPDIIPYLDIALIVKLEQVGKNLQLEPSKGEINCWYCLII